LQGELQNTPFSHNVWEHTRENKKGGGGGGGGKLKKKRQKIFFFKFLIKFLKYFKIFY